VSPSVGLAQEDLFPEMILQRRLVKKGNLVVVQILVKWLGLANKLATLGRLQCAEVSFS
jgi:hypothetical protein